MSNILGKVSEAALAKPYEGDQLPHSLHLPDEDILNVDETGHRCNKDSWWTWCFRAELYALYRIDAHRNAEVLMNTLGGEFPDGILGCDYFSAYRRYMKKCDIRVQFCIWPVSIRDVKFYQATLPDLRPQLHGRSIAGSTEEAVRGVPSTRATQQGRVSAPG